MILKGNASLINSTDSVRGWDLYKRIDGRLKHKQNALIVLSYYSFSNRYGNKNFSSILPCLLMEKFTLTLDGKEIKHGYEMKVEDNNKTKSFKGHTYKAIENCTASFSKAVAICKKMGGHLVYIETDEEMNFISKTFGDLRMWVGATDDLKEGDWRWLNGEKVSNKFWNTNEGYMGRTENKMFHYKGKFYDVAEPWANSRGFICEWELTNVK